MDYEDYEKMVETISSLAELYTHLKEWCDSFTNEMERHFQIITAQNDIIASLESRVQELEAGIR